MLLFHPCWFSAVRAIRPPIAIPVLLLLGGSLCLLLWLVIVPPLPDTGDSADGRPWAAGRRYACHQASMWETERRTFTSARCSRGDLGRSYSSTLGARRAASAPARGSPSSLPCSGSRPEP